MMRVIGQVSRRRILALAVLSVALLLAVLGCSGNAGKYVSEENPNDYLELRRDGSFFLQEEGVTLEGKYRVDGDEITLSMSFLGLSVPTKGRIVGNVIIDKDGEKWVKGALTPTKTTITVVPENFSIGSGKSVKLTAILQAGQNPLQGKGISWSATSGSVSPASGTTDSSGKVVITYFAPNERPANLPLSIAISASFAGSVLYTPSSADSLIGIKIGTHITARLIGAEAKSGESVSLSASLRDEKDNPLPGKKVVLLVDSQSNAQGVVVDPPSGVTDAKGQVTFTYTAPVVTFETTITFEASFSGDNKYLQSSEAYPWLVVMPSSGTRSLTIAVKRVQAGSGCSPDDPGPVETLDLEQEYLPVVVASENGAVGVPLEALKAQAVASRTFATYKMQYEPRSASFHVCDTEADQVYNPSVTVNPQVRKAVEDTRSIVARWNGEVIAAFFVKGDQASGTARFVTVNEGKTGNDVRPTSIGSLTNTHNRGAMGQDKANELASQRRSYQDILRYFYGADLKIQAIDLRPSSQDSYSHNLVTGGLALSGTLPYRVGQTLTARFTITSRGGADILEELTVGGRLNGVNDCSNTGGVCADFTKVRNVILQPGQSYAYQGTFTPRFPGKYDFQVFYLANGQWYWNLPSEDGANGAVKRERFSVTIPLVVEVLP